VQTVIRGATSVFYASDDAPLHDEAALRDDVRLSVQWIGHATTIIQLDDRLVITDPALTSTVGLLSKRLVKPAIEAPPPVDLAVISHMHFDHLSYSSLELLEDRIDLCVLPEGAFAYLPEFKFDARTPKRWETIEHRGIRITSVPAAHGGWRYGIDASWAVSAGGWVLERSGLTVYFAGDTGYDEAMFKAIAKRFPSIDVALLPIAPMEPHKLMGAWHMNPAEAVRAFKVLGAKTFIPMHYDTFINSLDTPGTAIPTLLKAAPPGTNIAVLKIGERRVLIPR
jgi:N-acyl-phosphatidylethanolamine-hydrolysing phospholipase D